MPLADTLKRTFASPAAQTLSSAELEHTVQKRIFLCMASFVMLATASYAVAYLVQNNTAPLPMLGLLTVFAAGCIAWAVKSGRYDWPLRTLGVCAMVLLAWSTLKQGQQLPAAGWWLSIIPFILAGGGLHRLAIAAVLAFIGIVTCLHFAPPGLLWGAPQEFIPSWRRYAAIIGSELLALTLIILAMRWRLDVARALDAARDAANAAGDTKARFLANISHDIRTPLNGIIGAAELLDSPGLSADQRQQLLGLQRQSANTLLALVNDVLDVAKLDAGKVTLETLPVFIRGLVFEANELFSVQACAKGIELTSSCAPDVPQVFRADPTRLRQIVNNLVGNAVKFTSVGGVHVHLSIDGIDPSDTPLRAGEYTVRIDVDDSGPGLSDAQLARLFVPFSQADSSTTRRYGGTGLGLSIAQELAALMGGRIEVRSTPALGSRFSFVAPLMSDAPAPAWHVPVQRHDILLATANAGVERHVWGLLHELAVQPRLQRSLPDAGALTACRLLVIDASLLQGLDASAWLAEHQRAGRRVAVLTPLGADAAVGAPGSAVLVYKPVRRRALQNLLASMQPSAPQDTPVTEEAADAPARFSGLHVLVAEDNPVNQVVVQAMLAELGASCVVAGDGEEALMKAGTTRFDLVLMDMHMPRMDGVSATRELRRREEGHAAPRLPIIAMTAHTESEGGKTCQEAGMDLFLSKPFGLTQLRRCLGQALALRDAAVTP